MAIHYKGLRNQTCRYHTGPVSLTTIEKDGFTSVVTETIKPIDDANLYSPDYLVHHPDCMVTGKTFDITSNDDVEDIINSSLDTLESISLDNNTESINS